MRVIPKEAVDKCDFLISPYDERSEKGTYCITFVECIFHHRINACYRMRSHDCFV
jgi:hypothetical protein